MRASFPLAAQDEEGRYRRWGYRSQYDFIDGDAHHRRDLFSNFGMRLFRYAKNTQDQGGPMPIVTAVVLSMLLLAMTGCATSSPPPAAKQETGKKDSTVKPAKHDEGKDMNEESQNAIR
jgi:hypothetical protein